MHRNYFTLYHAAGELRSRLVGGYLFEVYSQKKNELTIAFITNDRNHLQLVVTTANPRLGLCVREGLNRKKRNSAGLMPEIYEQEVLDFRMDTADRIIHVILESGYKLELRLFTGRTNVVLLNDEKKISSFKEHIATPPSQFRPDVLKTLEKLACNEEVFCRELRANGSDTTIKRLQALLPGFDRFLVRTLLQRAGNPDDHPTLHIEFRKLFFELIEPHPTLIIDDKGEPFLSILETPEKKGKSFETVLEALSFYCSRTWQFLGATGDIRDLKQALLEAQKKAQSMIRGASSEELESAIEHSTTMGHLLMSNIGNQSRKPTSIQVTNLFDSESETVTIQLKPELSIHQNAERYFTKAAKTRGKIAAMQHRKTEGQRIAACCELLLEKAATLKTPSDLRNFNETYTRELREAGIKSRKSKNGKSFPFRTVALPSGATLFLGKNAANNDLLTFSFAKPHDIWLHARGSSGSHGILRGSCMQNRTDIQRAAEIVAFHSAARHSTMVPVMYTEKKYVRKSGSRLPGQVRLDREEVILVTPSCI